MTGDDPITAIVDQLAAHAEQLTRLEASASPEHHAAVSRRWPSSPARPPPSAASLEEHAAALSQLAATSPARPGPRRLRPRAGTGVVEAGRRRPPGPGRPAAGLGRAGVPARLRAPGGQPGRVLGQHPPVPVRPGLAAELWSVLYLQPARTPALVSAQAE